MAEHERHTVHRTGLPPLEFEGWLAAKQEGAFHAGRELNRWYDLRLYRLADGRYVLKIVYRTCWQGESDNHFATVGDESHIISELASYPAPDHCKGYPDGKAYADRQAALKRDLWRVYRHRAGELLAEAGIVERVE